MSFPPLLALFCLSSSLLAQQATPAPKNAPFGGFGGTALDRRPTTKTGSMTPSVPKTSGSSLDLRPQPTRLPPTSESAPNDIGTSSLDQRPTGARVASSAPSASTLPPLATARGLSFEAKNQSSGGGTDVQRIGATGPAGPTVASPPGITKTTVIDRHPILKLSVRNVRHEADRAQFDWFFVAKAIGCGSLFIWDQGERELAVAAGQERTDTLESRPLLDSTTVETHGELVKENSYGQTSVGSTYVSGTGYAVQAKTSSSRAGAEPNGWIVRMFVDGKLAKVQASSNQLEILGRDPAQLAALLERESSRASDRNGKLPPIPPGPQIPAGR